MSRNQKVANALDAFTKVLTDENINERDLIAVLGGLAVGMGAFVGVSDPYTMLNRTAAALKNVFGPEHQQRADLISQLAAVTNRNAPTS